jgi:hypothetical protein
MSDIKRPTILSIVFERLADALYGTIYRKFAARLRDTDTGSEERCNEALDIVKNLGFIDRRVSWLANLLTNVSFWFMVDVSEDEYEAARLGVERLEEDTDD